MKEDGSNPKSNKKKKSESASLSEQGEVPIKELDSKKTNDKLREKKKKKRNFWPLKALVITLLLSAAVNAASELAFTDANVWLTYVITIVILAISVFFDIIGTAATSCEIGPFLAMASRKVKGARTAVNLCQHNDTVSSVCNDVIGDVCGIVSGVCSAVIVSTYATDNIFLLSVITYATISTATVTFKAIGKGYAINNANRIIFDLAKFLSIFNKNG